MLNGINGAFTNLRLLTESNIDSFIGAEEICNDGKLRAFYLSKKQSFPLTLDHPSMDLG